VDTADDDEEAVDSFQPETTPIAAAGSSLAAPVVIAPTGLSSSPDPTRDQPPEVPASEARYLRTYEAFPSLPRSLWGSGRVYAVLVQVCVSADGGVSGVSIRNGAAPELDRVITSTVRSWRYRPRMVEGAARPFCHLMKFVYTTR
jgi:TonB family protein